MSGTRKDIWFNTTPIKQNICCLTSLFNIAETEFLLQDTNNLLELTHVWYHAKSFLGALSAWVYYQKAQYPGTLKKK